MEYKVVVSSLEDGSEVADVVVQTESAMVPVWEAPSVSSARIAETMFNMVAKRVEACGSNREMADLLSKLQEALGE